MTWREFFAFPRKPRPWLIWSSFLACVASNVNGVLNGSSVPIRLMSVAILVVFALMYFWLYQRTQKECDYWFKVSLHQLDDFERMLKHLLKQIGREGEEWRGDN